MKMAQNDHSWKVTLPVCCGKNGMCGDLQVKIRNIWKLCKAISSLPLNGFENHQIKKNADNPMVRACWFTSGRQVVRATTLIICVVP